MPADNMAIIQDIVRAAARGDKNRSLLRSCHTFSASLYFLARRWKPCLLFDFGSASNDLLLNIRQVVGRDALILTLNGSERFLCCGSVLLAHISQLLTTTASHHDSPPILDISPGSGWPPKMVDEAVWSDLVISLQQLQAALEQLVSEEEQLGAGQLEVELPSSCNLSTIFGLLLGYPVLYWSQPSQLGNNLSGQELAVYSVTCAGATPVSFSVPVASLSHVQVAAAVGNWGRQAWPSLKWNSTVETPSGESIYFNRFVRVLPLVAL